MSKVGEVLLRLLKVYSPNGEERVLEDTLLKIARELGLEAKSDSVGNVIAGREDAEVALVSHYDTVPGELEVARVGSELRGRGAVDAKGPLASMLVAASKSRYPVMVIALVDEEGESRGAMTLSERLIPPYIIIGEPSNSTGVVVSYRGSARLILECRSRGGHSSHPGESAVDKLLEALDELREFSFPGASLSIIRISGGSSFSVLPRYALAELDLRFSRRGDAQLILRELSAQLSDGCSIQLMRVTEPVSVRPIDPVPRALVRAVISSGGKPRLLRKYGTSDMNILAEKVRSIAAYGPGNSELAHTDEEKVSEEELEFSVGVYIKAIDYLYSMRGI